MASISNGESGSSVRSKLNALLAAASNRSVTQYTTAYTGSDSIPQDTSIPQIGEGKSLISTTFAASSVTAVVRVEVDVPFQSGAINTWVAALFYDGAANAVRARALSSAGGSGFVQCITFAYEHVPGTTLSKAYELRFGGGASFNLNGNNSVSLGGAAPVEMRIQEIAAA